MHADDAVSCKLLYTIMQIFVHNHVDCCASGAKTCSGCRSGKSRLIIILILTGAAATLAVAVVVAVVVAAAAAATPAAAAATAAVLRRHRSPTHTLPSKPEQQPSQLILE